MIDPETDLQHWAFLQDHPEAAVDFPCDASFEAFLTRLQSHLFEPFWVDLRSEHLVSFFASFEAFERIARNTPPPLYTASWGQAFFQQEWYLAFPESFSSALQSLSSDARSLYPVLYRLLRDTIAQDRPCPLLSEPFLTPFIDWIQTHWTADQSSFFDNPDPELPALYLLALRHKPIVSTRALSLLISGIRTYNPSFWFSKLYDKNAHPIHRPLQEALISRSQELQAQGHTPQSQLDSIVCWIKNGQLWPLTPTVASWLTLPADHYTQPFHPPQQESSRTAWREQGHLYWRRRILELVQSQPASTSSHALEQRRYCLDYCTYFFHTFLSLYGNDQAPRFLQSLCMDLTQTPADHFFPAWAEQMQLSLQLGTSLLYSRLHESLGVSCAPTGSTKRKRL